MAKGEFATAIGVSAGRVSQMIADGTIGADALEGEGRRAQVRVDIAKAQIAERRHPGQALGNGLGTKVVDAAADLLEPGEPTLARQLQEQRLEAEQRRNRIAAREEAVVLGQLVPVEQVRAEMGRMAQAIEDANAGMLSDFASAIAGVHGLSQRDLLHLLRKVRNEKRQQAADRARTQAEAIPATVEFTTPSSGEDRQPVGGPSD